MFQRLTQHHHPPPRSGHTHSGGFTLLEILLALGLSVLLLSAVYAAIDLHWRFTSAGREEIERSQIARALLRKMEGDIRSIVFREPQSTSYGDDTSDDDDSSSGDSRIEVEDSSDANNPNSMGLMGDSSTLLLQISRPPRDLIYSPLGDTESEHRHTSDLQSVGYFLAIAGAEGLQGLVGDYASSDLTDDGTGIQGLARLEGDVLRLKLADEQSDLETQAANTRILAREVKFLEFRYFDGISWIDHWDSNEIGGLPRAIEVRLAFRLPEEANVDLFSEFSNTSGVFRHVVALPLAATFPPTSEY